MRGRVIERGIGLPAGLRTVCDGLDHPEGICWCPTAQALYAGGEHGQIYRVGLTSGAVELIAQISNGFILGLAVDGDGRIYACDIGNHRVQRVHPVDGTITTYGSCLAYPNYPVFAVDGCLYVSDSGSWDADADGSIMRIDPGGYTSRLDTPPLRFPNGLALLGIGSLSWNRRVPVWRKCQEGEETSLSLSSLTASFRMVLRSMPKAAFGYRVGSQIALCGLRPMERWTLLRMTGAVSTC